MTSRLHSPPKAEVVGNLNFCSGKNVDKNI